MLISHAFQAIILFDVLNRWAKLFFGKTEEGSNERLNINDNDADLSYVEDVQDKVSQCYYTAYMFLWGFYNFDLF